LTKLIFNDILRIVLTKTAEENRHGGSHGKVVRTRYWFTFPTRKHLRFRGHRLLSAHVAVELAHAGTLQSEDDRYLASARNPHPEWYPLQ